MSLRFADSLKIKQLYVVVVNSMLTNQNQYDFIIQGAGASGLWLAYWLNEMDVLRHQRLLIVEGDPNKVDDRTWCFWSQDSEGTFPFVDSRWSSLWVQNQQQSIAPYRYHHARSSAFYAWVKEDLSKNPNVCWHQGWVTSISERGESVSVDLEGEQVHARYFFGSASAMAADWSKDVTLWQSFVGWRIKFQPEHSGWDHSAATLMDFSISHADTTRFLYVLPLSNREGLIEVTQFDATCLTAEAGEKILREICVQRGWQVDVLDVECDAIPMSSKFSEIHRRYTSHDRIINIGVKAGALKPTTGYGFLTMRSHGKAIAHAIKFDLPIPRIYRKRRFRFYDTLLLHILRSTPQKGKPIFERLFDKQPATRVLKFLDEKTSLWEEVGIFSRLQISWFLKALFQYERN
jgi:lycopene beta-cyclase